MKTTSDSDPTPLTIGRLAREAGVGIETIRYYQRVKLLPQPEPAPPGKAFRHYPAALIERLRFIKRAQGLGFSLDEVAALLNLNDGTDRHQVRQLARARLANVRAKITDLQHMEAVLAQLLDACEHTDEAHCCPIIAAFSAGTADLKQA
jgi:MerR family mercuric resistance operon transcriptional regulator